jgi:hypothetical protein
MPRKEKQPIILKELEAYKEECRRQGINSYSLNPIFFAYRDKHWIFDYFLSVIEFSSAPDLVEEVDEQGRIRYQSAIRDRLVDKLTGMILKELNTNYNIPAASWSCHGYLWPKNDNPEITERFRIFIQDGMGDTEMIMPSFAPILLLYLRHGYQKQFRQLAAVLSPARKSRNTFPAELRGKDLTWEKISDTHWEVTVSAANRQSPAQLFWDGLENERRHYDPLREHFKHVLAEMGKGAARE